MICKERYHHLSLQECIFQSCDSPKQRVTITDDNDDDGGDRYVNQGKVESNL